MNSLLIKNAGLGKLHTTLLSFIGIGFILAVNGAVPFVMMPTLGQAVWTSGFSLSFANNGLFSVYADNFGAPAPAPISFGLPAAWPMSVLIRVGLDFWDAYAAVFAGWLIVAFWGTRRLAIHYRLKKTVASLAAVCWLTTPMIWGHASYSMLSLGLALIPTYLLTIVFVNEQLQRRSLSVLQAMLVPATFTIATFMDGYSLIMFSIAAGLVTIGQYWSIRGIEPKAERFLACSISMMLVSLALAYALYSSYIGKTSFNPHSLATFRGWGADLTFFAVPTQGMHWLPDLLGASEYRDHTMYWGDASVWNTTFLLPLLLAAAGLILRDQQIKYYAVPFAVFLVGIYMALGPALKINFIKPAELSMQRSMTEDIELIGTGSAVISQLPVFKVMRASYRWTILATLGLWLLIVIRLGREYAGSRVLPWAAFGLIVACYFPAPQKIAAYVNTRHAAVQLQADLGDPFVQDFKGHDEAVVMLPWGNDFMANYLGGMADITLYNVGGDKNYLIARRAWPAVLISKKADEAEANLADVTQDIFDAEIVSAVVIPFFDMLWSAHAWPPDPETYRTKFATELEKLRNAGFSVTHRPFYAVIRSTPGTGSMPR